MSNALRFSFDVECEVVHAFETWTERIGTWWPRDHTISGSPLAIVVEGRVDGRIYERTEHGDEHEWGVVTAWRPPELLAFLWHLGVGEEFATHVAVSFTAQGTESTRIEIEQSGWERLGSAAEELRQRNRVGWTSLELHFRAAVEEGA
jgi:hypothetical protein